MSKKITLILTSIAILGFTGCTDSSDLLSLSTSTQTKTYNNYENASESKKTAFEQKQRSVGLQTQQDPQYRSFRTQLNTQEDKDWFSNSMYLLWDRQITRSQYISNGVSKIPSYRYEFTFIANQF